MSHASDARLSWQRTPTGVCFGSYTIHRTGGWFRLDFGGDTLALLFTLAAAKRFAIAHLAAELHGREHVREWERQRSRAIAWGRA